MQCLMEKEGNVYILVIISKCQVELCILIFYDISFFFAGHFLDHSIHFLLSMLIKHLDHENVVQQPQIQINLRKRNIR